MKFQVGDLVEPLPTDELMQLPDVRGYLSDDGYWWALYGIKDKYYEALRKICPVRILKVDGSYGYPSLVLTARYGNRDLGLSHKGLNLDYFWPAEAFVHFLPESRDPVEPPENDLFSALLN